jgi:hypothetical protein
MYNNVWYSHSVLHVIFCEESHGNNPSQLYKFKFLLKYSKVGRVYVV